jgi:murein DD-endopeptidase MepM/ murein hydrolase activator NlpD
VPASVQEAAMPFPIAKGEKYGVRWKRPGAKGGFGADRKRGRLHAGCDIGAAPGVHVVAIDSGKVIEAPKRPFIRNTDLFAIAVKHSSGIVARYTEINKIPTRFTKGAEVSAGEALGVVASQGDLSMLHFELYSGDRSGTLSVPWGLWPRGKRPVDLSAAERSRIIAAGYLPDYMRRADLIDPTELLIRLEKGASLSTTRAEMIAIGLRILGHPVLGLAYAAAYATRPATPLPAAPGPVGDHTTSRPYEGVTGIALEGPTITTTEPRDGHPRDYWGATDVAMPEPD